MKTFAVHDNQGTVHAFEVGNTLLSRRRACRIAASVPGVQIVRWPRRWSWKNDDEFCEFRLGDSSFVIIEPFGDNSRFLIAPKDGESSPPIDAVRDAFAGASIWSLKSPWAIVVLGATLVAFLTWWGIWADRLRPSEANPWYSPLLAPGVLGMLLVRALLGEVSDRTLPMAIALANGAVWGAAIRLGLALTGSRRAR
jgi:hypothetical protein